MSVWWSARLEREERRVCSTCLAWGGRRNLASKLLSYFFTTILSQMLESRMEDVWLGCRQGDCPSPWQPGLSFPGHQQVHLLGEEPLGPDLLRCTTN